jgi:hypothetical protein
VLHFTLAAGLLNTVTIGHLAIIGPRALQSSYAGFTIRLVSVAKCVDLGEDSSVMRMNWA